jgi:hypothetical protein
MGRVRIDGKEFYIVDRHGYTLFQKSIPPGEPADLIDIRFRPLYKKYGREKFIECLKANGDIKSVSAMRKALKELTLKELEE